MIVELPKEVQSTFATIAQERNTTKELLAKEAIIEWIQDFEDAREADKAHEEFMRDNEIILANDLYKDLGLK